MSESVRVRRLIRFLFAALLRMVAGGIHFSSHRRVSLQTRILHSRWRLLLVQVSRMRAVRYRFTHVEVLSKRRFLRDN